MSSILRMGVTYERVLLPVKFTAGADKASKVRGGDFSNIWLVLSSRCILNMKRVMILEYN